MTTVEQKHLQRKTA